MALGALGSCSTPLPPPDERQPVPVVLMWGDVCNEVDRQVEGKPPREGFFDGWTIRAEVDSIVRVSIGGVGRTHWREGLDVIAIMSGCEVTELPGKVLVLTRKPGYEEREEEERQAARRRREKRAAEKLRRRE